MLENFENSAMLVSFSDEAGKLSRIKKYASELIEFTKGMDFEAYQKNIQINYACAFALLQIGTIGNRLASEVQLKLEIPWRAIVAARNASVHGHSNSHKAIIWDELKNIPALILKLDEQISKISK